MSSSSSKLATPKTDFKQLSSSEKSAIKKIESPFAKYNSIGQLTCIICNQIIKSELMWSAHLNSKTHIENKNNLKSKLIKEPSSSKSNIVNKQKEVKEPSEAPNHTNTFKRPFPVPTSSILKEDDDGEELNIGKKQKLENLINKIDTVDLNLSNEVTTEIQTETTITKSSIPDEEEEASIVDLAAPSALPEGFFDDPELDAKARGVSRAEKLDAEYEEFRKIIQTEEVKSDVLIEKDDVLRDVDRDLDEVEELITRWTKIENMHQKREELLAASKLRKENLKAKDQSSEDESDDSDIDLDNVLNLALRSKNRC